MARMVVTTGACPVCDRDVPRTVHLYGGMPKETFHCPSHGRLAYSPHSHPMADLPAAMTPVLAGWSQAVTGLEMVH